jgi:hypothetical protein
MGSELATEVGSVGVVRVDEVAIVRVDVVGKDVVELESASAHVDVGDMGPPLKDMGIKERRSDNPRSKTETLASTSSLTLTTNQTTQIEENCDIDDSTDEDYSVGDEDEYEDDGDLFAENVVYGLDDVFIGDDDLRVVVDKEIDEENNKDIYYNGEEDELESDDDDLGALNDEEEGLSSYPTFNPEVDFKGKISLSLGLKFPSTHVFRKAPRYHAIECGYNYYYLHNGGSRWCCFYLHERQAKGMIVYIFYFTYSFCYNAKTKLFLM